MTEEEEFAKLREFFSHRKRTIEKDKGGMPSSAVPGNPSTRLHDRKTDKIYKNAIEASVDTNIPIPKIIESCKMEKGRFKWIVKKKES